MKFHKADEPPVVKIDARYVTPREQRHAQKSFADEKCRITVEDNGIGFDEQYAERIFGIFQRLHTRDLYEGTGIGLAICRRIVEFHGGEINAHSVPGQGSTFEIVLPAAQAKKAQRGGMMAKQHGPFTILMADDDADDCLLAQEALRESGQPHELRIVRDGQQLLDYLRQQGEYQAELPSPRPELDSIGSENAPQRRSRGPRGVESRSTIAEHPIVVLTTSTARDDIAFCYRMGANSYITKPATFRGLVDLLATICKYWFELAELPFVD